jgi:hypothetical protein
MKARPETFRAAQARLFAELQARGWIVNARLKRPTATKGDIKLTFRAQAVYLGERSLWVDVRGLDVASFLRLVEQAVNHEPQWQWGD